MKVLISRWKSFKNNSILDQKALAVNFVDEFYRNAYRGFSDSTIEIFSKMKHTNFDDVLYPARETLTGDLGDNGCAMYIAPIALLCVKNESLDLSEQIRKAAALTHYYDMAVNGAIVQATAIHNLVKTDGPLNIDNFLDGISVVLKSNSPKTEGPSFVGQIEQVKKLLNVQNPSEDRIVNVLGHSQKALYSVPTAIYCFLRSVKYEDEVCLPRLISYLWRHLNGKNTIIL